MNYQPDLIVTSLKMLTALIGIIGILLLCQYFLKKNTKQGSSRKNEKLIGILANRYIGVKKYISLVEVPGAVLVLGIAGENISLLHKIENLEILNEYKELDSEKGALSFIEQIKKTVINPNGIKKAEDHD